MSEEKKPLSWEKEELPKIFMKMETILYQTSWLMKEEIKRQMKQAEKVKTLFEQEMRSQSQKDNQRK